MRCELAFVWVLAVAARMSGLARTQPNEEVDLLSDICTVCGFTAKVAQQPSQLAAQSVAFRQGMRQPPKVKQSVAAPIIQNVTALQLKIGVSLLEPFVRWKDSGEHSFGLDGFSIELWEAITTSDTSVQVKDAGSTAAKISPHQPVQVIDFVYIKDTLEHNIQNIVSGEIDVIATGISQLAIPQDKGLQFSSAFWYTGVQVMVKTGKGGMAISEMASLVFWLLLPILLSIMIAGHIFWLIEAALDPPDFEEASVDKSYLKGVGLSIWWSAVTMTTVGYGDVYPKKKCGKVFGLIWMFASLFLLATFIGGLTAILTLNQIGESRITGLNDIKSADIATVAGTYTDTFITEHITPKSKTAYVNYTLAIEALVEGHVEAVVGSSDVLKYWANSDNYRSVVNLVGGPVAIHPLVLVYSKKVPKEVAKYFDYRLLDAQAGSGIDYLVTQYFHE